MDACLLGKVRSKPSAFILRTKALHEIGDSLGIFIRGQSVARNLEMGDWKIFL